MEREKKGGKNMDGKIYKKEFVEKEIGGKNERERKGKFKVTGNEKEEKGKMDMERRGKLGMRKKM